MNKIYEEFVTESDMDIFSKEVKDIVEELKKVFEIYFSSFDPIVMLDYKVTRMLTPYQDAIDQEYGYYRTVYEKRYKTLELRKKIYNNNRKSYDNFFNELRSDMRQDLITMRRSSKDILLNINRLIKLFEDNSDIKRAYFGKFFKSINEKVFDGYIKFAEKLKKGLSMSDQEIIRILTQEDFYKGNKPTINEKAFLFIDEKSYLNLTLIGG